MQNSIADRGKTNRGEEPVRIESSSRPGLVHFVSADFRHCSCPATVKVCRHLRIALIRAAKNEAVGTDNLLDATVTGLGTMPGTSTLTREKPRYGMTSEAPGALYDDEPRGKVWEYTGYGEDRTRRFIAEFGTEYGAERAVSDLRAGNERGREILRRSRTSNEAVSYPDTRKEAA